MSRRKSDSDLFLLEQYKGMIFKLAFQTWRDLPTSVKMWISPEDLISEAYLYVLSARKHYRQHRGSWSTFVWTGVSHMLMNIASSHRVQKRFGWSVPLEDIQWLGNYDKDIAQKESLDALSRVYREATPQCRAEIRRWFGQEPVRVKWSGKAKEIAAEFQLLAYKNGLAYEDCRELMRGGVWIRE